MINERRIVLFTGHVQGVGFRFTAQRVSDDHDVLGTVRNLPDGRVECIIEGSSKQSDAFVADVSERMSGFIHGVTQQSAPVTGEFSSFEVIF